jgi:ferredoxin
LGSSSSSSSLMASATEQVLGATEYSDSQVDMNQYNLPVDQIAEEWTAILVPESTMREEGIYLGARSSKTIMVDTVKVEIPRRQGEGMGIELMEIAGGREDGYGITVVNGIVDGGCADGSGIMVGDSIAQLSVKNTGKGSGGGMSQVEYVDSIGIECLGYDKTVEAIVNLPAVERSNDDVDDDTIILTLKRLRRKPKVTVRLQYPPYENEPDTVIELFAGENLRRAMLTRGVKLNDVLSRRFDSGGTGDCGADGTCATCVIGVSKGVDLISPQKIQEKQILKKNPRWRLACKATVGYGMREGELTLQVNPRQWDNKKDA